MTISTKSLCLDLLRIAPFSSALASLSSAYRISDRNIYVWGTIFMDLLDAKVKAKATVKDRTNDRAIGLYGNQGLLHAKPLSRVLSIVQSKYQEAALSKHLKLTLVNSKEVLW